MMAGPTEGEIDAKIAASEARTETKLAVLEAKTEARHIQLATKLDQISTSISQQRAEAKSNLTAVITTVMGVGVALFGLIVALVTYGDALFGRGMEAGDKLDAAAKHAVERQILTQPKAP